MKAAVRAPIAAANGKMKFGKHRTFQEMINWRKTQEKRERTLRNQKLTRNLESKVPPRFQLAGLQAFTKSSARDTVERESWESLGISDTLVKGLLEGMKLPKPNETQKVMIPRLLSTKNGSGYLCAAQTGSGKTLAYLLPLMQQLKVEEERILARTTKSTEKLETLSQLRPARSPRAVILLPTHELVDQVYRVAKGLGHYCKLRIEKVDTWKVKKETEGMAVDIAICTPKQFLLASENRMIKCSKVKHLVVDEADTLMAVDFGEQVREILGNVKKHSQQQGEPLQSFIAVSATIPRSLHRSLEKDYPSLQIIAAKGLHEPSPLLRQRFQRITDPGDAKKRAVLEIIREHPTHSILVFCNSAVKANALHRYLADRMIDTSHENNTEANITENGNTIINALPSLFHGFLPEQQRSSLLQKFKEGTIKVLICTDLASRGLDTLNVNHIVNYDFPRSPLDYLHRVGRTGRAGRGGVVTNLVTKKDEVMAEFVQLLAKRNQPLSTNL